MQLARFFSGGLQLLLGLFQVLLGGEDLRLAVLAVDPHQNLTGRYGEIVHQITGDHRAADGGVQISHRGNIASLAAS